MRLHIELNKNKDEKNKILFEIDINIFIHEYNILYDNDTLIRYYNDSITIKKTSKKIGKRYGKSNTILSIPFSLNQENFYDLDYDLYKYLYKFAKKLSNFGLIMNDYYKGNKHNNNRLRVIQSGKEDRYGHFYNYYNPLTNLISTGDKYILLNNT